MSTFYYSQDFFVLKETVQKKKAAFLKSNPAGVVINFDLENIQDLENFKENLKTNSLFSEKKILLARNIFTCPEAAGLSNVLKIYFKNPNKEISLIFSETSSSVELIKKDKSLFNFLCESCAQVKEITSPKNTSPKNNFALTDAIANKEKIKALALLDQRLSEGEDPQAILGLVAYQFRVLLKIKSLVKKAVPYGSLARLANLHPFVIRKNYENARRFELEDLKRIYRELCDADINTKNGTLNLSDFLFSFLMKNQTDSA